MVHTASPLLLLLSLALLAPGLSVRQCLLTGNWTNDLGSNMNIGDVSDSGEFSGTYVTPVDDVPQNIMESILLGIQSITDDQPTFGFIVRSNFTESTTVFTGQCFMDRRGKEVLKTMWLLRSNADDTDDDWKATRVGNHIFTRTQ